MARVHGGRGGAGPPPRSSPRGASATRRQRFHLQRSPCGLRREYGSTAAARLAAEAKMHEHRQDPVRSVMDFLPCDEAVTARRIAVTTARAGSRSVDADNFRRAPEVNRLFGNRRRGDFPRHSSRRNAVRDFVEPCPGDKTGPDKLKLALARRDLNQDKLAALPRKRVRHISFVQPNSVFRAKDARATQYFRFALVGYPALYPSNYAVCGAKTGLKIYPAHQSNTAPAGSVKHPDSPCMTLFR